jgi:protein-tyrosine phosphatase
MRKLVDDEGFNDKIHLDSAGTHAYHVHEPPDPRAQEAAARRGIDISDLRARAVEIADFHTFDLIVAMDRENLSRLEQMQPAGSRAKLSLMLSWAENRIFDEVPDPYYGGVEGFERVLDMLENASRGLLAQLGSRR